MKKDVTIRQVYEASVEFTVNEHEKVNYCVFPYSRC